MERLTQFSYEVSRSNASPCVVDCSEREPQLVMKMCFADVLISSNIPRDFDETR